MLPAVLVAVLLAPAAAGGQAAAPAGAGAAAQLFSKLVGAPPCRVPLRLHAPLSRLQVAGPLTQVFQLCLQHLLEKRRNEMLQIFQSFCHQFELNT